MRKILTILTFIAFANSVNANDTLIIRFDSTKVVTIRATISYVDTTHYYDYFKVNGVLAWGNVKGYDPLLIPPGGKAIQKGYVDRRIKTIKGFIAVRWTYYGALRDIVRWMDLTYKEIKDKDILPHIDLR